MITKKVGGVVIPPTGFLWKVEMCEELSFLTHG